ncbi:hypothetical protein PN498_17585 [Oscillatoria sp. CS-180]|uniref:hypothetical protein n=1 Tax=Oscillatoria sp. CS-180 TaxID=3021720 RepID=UPI00232B9FA4|nr:hypothetical protein [Oscillatoria sp. CS-180]MDB9527811.1 hypothetical protein [Oscillatoria sp. CS-180]
MQRSLGITLIAILQAIISISSVASGIFLLLLITGTVQVFSHDLSELSPSLKGLVALGFAISLFGAVVTCGLWNLKRWGWIGSLMFQALCLANNGLAIALGQEITRNVYLSAIISMALCGALWMPSVREAFAVNSAIES